METERNSLDKTEEVVVAGIDEDVDVELGEEDAEVDAGVDRPAWMSMVYKGFMALLLLGFAVYSIIAFTIDFDRALPLFYLWIVAAVFAAFKLAYVFCGSKINEVTGAMSSKYEAVLATTAGKIGFAVFTLALIAVMVATAVTEAKQLIGILGIVCLVLLSYVTSFHRTKIIWRPVVGGLLFQFVFGFLILRTEAGFNVFNFFGDQISILLDYSKDGASFVFSYLAQDQFESIEVTGIEVLDNDGVAVGPSLSFTADLPPKFAVFAFSVLPTVIFFSALVSMLYYVGALQVLIRVIGSTLATLLGTSASESLSAAGNIFVGQTEAPLLIRPFLKDMTKSELHAVMTGGFATIAGGVLAAFISFGVNPSQLLAASVMSAPAALAVSKIIYPEVEVSKTRAGVSYEIDTPEFTNILEAASTGAADAIWLALNIGGQLIAFVGLIAFANAILAFFGEFIDQPDLSFEKVSGWVFYPFAYVIGVDVDDCEVIAQLMGVKIFGNEFIAFLGLADLINAEDRTLSARSEIVATFALCGFSNFASMGIQLGGLTPLAPNKKKALAQLVFSAMIAGNTACFLTGAVASILYDETRGLVDNS